MKKKLLTICLSFAFSCAAFSQGVGIGTASPDASAVLDITHTAKGVLIPRMSATAINGITNPAKGLLVYDSVGNQLMLNTGTPASPHWEAVGSNYAGWALTGNNGVNPSNQFIGTVDNQPLRFRINNVPAGELHPTTGNIFWGIGAGQANTAGLNNIAIGAGALKSNAGSRSLVAIGDSALFNNGNNNTTPDMLGIANTAIGSKALFSNTTGNNNTAQGFNALFSNTTGANNTATGNSSLFFTTIGHDNTASGDHSLFANTIGFNNTGIGSGSLQVNSSGSDNTAIGMNAMFSNTTGFVNTAIGFSALFSNTSGNGIQLWGNFPCTIIQPVLIIQRSAISPCSLTLQEFKILLWVLKRLKITLAITM
jgi:hypothetical protein